MVKKNYPMKTWKTLKNNLFVKIIITKIISLVILLTYLNCNAKHSESQESLSQVKIKTETSKEIPIKIKTIDDEFVTLINIETDVINFKIYYFKNDEIAYLKLDKSQDFKPVHFCVNLSSMNEATNNIKLLKKDSFYYLMLPSCSEELPMFHVLKFDNLNYYKDLGVYTFKHDERIFRLGKFKSIKYTLVDNPKGIGIKGTLSGQQFDLSEITEFDSSNKISSQNLNYIKQLTNKDNNQKNSNSEINTFLFKKFNFNCSITKLETEENYKYLIKMSLINKETNSIQNIDFTPEALYSKSRISNTSSYSYFNPKQSVIKASEGIEKYHGLIVLDYNFDGLEDFAIINFEGSNGGPQYAYFKQKSNGQFELDSSFTNEIRFFPLEINNKEKFLNFGHPSGCCQIETFTVKFLPNKKWKVTESKLEDIK